MAAVDIARVAGLSTLALLAAKTTRPNFNSFKSKTEAEPFDVRRLRSAIEYLEDALDGLQKGTNRTISSGTVQALSSYQSATQALRRYSTRQGSTRRECGKGDAGSRQDNVPTSNSGLVSDHNGCLLKCSSPSFESLHFESRNRDLVSAAEEQRARAY